MMVMMMAMVAFMLVAHVLMTRMLVPYVGVMNMGPMRLMVMVRLVLGIVCIGNAGAEHHRSGGDCRHKSRPHFVSPSLWAFP
jgi:hypothetical protein